MNSIIKQNPIICNPLKQKNIDVASWIRLLKTLKISKMFQTLPDSRQQSKTRYTLSSLLMWALSVSAFRQGSKNAFQTTLQDLPHKKREGILRMLEIKGKDIPHSTTVDYALSHIPQEEVNKLFLEQFDALLRKKFFYNHLDLLFDDDFTIGADGYWTHTYDHPHAVDKEGNNCCPYCLPRTKNKGTEKEKTYYVHVLVTFVLITKELKLPLYNYPLKAKQVNAKQSDKNLKQECELQAAYEVLPLLRKRYPRLSFTFLGDALYSNRPFIRLLETIKFNYLIVLKENFKTLNNKCDELATLDLYKKGYAHSEKRTERNQLIERKAQWFNHVDAHQGVVTNVLRFEETVTKGESSKTVYKGSWISSERIYRTNCFSQARKARKRWNHEDLHNTCKNRGFNIKHDMARANPNLLLVWKMILFMAFFLFEIFRCSRLAKAAQKSRSLMKFARDMLGQLIEIDWEVIAKSPILTKARVQFRFSFNFSPH